MQTNSSTRHFSVRTTVARIADVVVAVLVVALIVGGYLVTKGGPTFVARITISNPTPFPLEVDVNGASGHSPGVLQLGTLNQSGKTDFEQVIDQGAVWEFRFSYLNHPSGKVVISKSVLAANGWRVRVPANAGEQLRRAGLEPPPSGP